jgi:TonB-linked SusC/RagA family outer membrane protein
LNKILPGKGFEFIKTGNTIAIKKINTLSGNAKKKTTGRVLDERGEPVVGATIMEKGTTNGTVSDYNGDFDLEINPGSEILISYIGYNTLALPGNNYQTVQLKEDIRALDEIVVVGYGTQKKVNLTGSVASVSSEDMKDRVQTDVLSSIQGMVPGVTIISRPGRDVSINFRGRGNLGSSEPLYVIDGAIADATFFSNLDPNSIENISFLKDAASSAIYGSRAAYGVVLVTTKQGKEGRMDISYSGMVGMKAPTYTQDLVNSWEYAELYNEALYNTNPSAGKNQGYSDNEIELLRKGTEPDLYPNTNWVDLVFDDWAVTTKHSLNLSGGTEKLRYFTGLGYIYDTENIRNRDARRYNLNLNVASDVTDWLTFRGSVKYIQRNRDVDGSTPSFDNMLIVPSTFVARQSNGEWGSVDSGREASGTFAGGNPLRAYSTNDWVRNTIENTMYELAFDLKPVKGLVITGQGTYKSFEYKNKAYTSLKDDVPSFLNPGTVIGGTGNTINSMEINWRTHNFLTYTGTANYTRTQGVHSFAALAGVSYEHYREESLMASRQDFPADSFEDLSAGATSGSLYKNGSGMQEYKMFSYFGRINYMLMERYLFEANLRADASSRFHADNRWGYFPSFSTGWRISEESFMENTRDIIDNLKFRASYGTLGNINNVGNYDYFQNYGSRGTYSFDDSSAKAIGETKPANPSLNWEKVALTDIGLDFDLWNGKLSGTIDYYIKNTSNILLGYNVPLETGISNAPSQNVAKVRNRGFEFAMIHRNKIGDASYTIGANIATNNNEITDLSYSKDIINNLENGHGVAKYILREGESIGSFYGFRSNGLYTQEEIDAGHYYTYGGVTPNAGDTKFIPQRQLNWGEEITDKDRTIIGCEVPDFTYGINLSVYYKNVEFSVFGQGINGVDVAFEVYQVHPFFHGQDNPRKYHMGRWTEANPDPHAIYPRIYTASSPHTTYNRAFNDYHLFDADYFRFKTMALGYIVPKNVVARLGISSLKVYLTGENLFTIRADHKMKDFDPEATGSIVRALGSKSMAFGVNISF